MFTDGVDEAMGVAACTASTGCSGCCPAMRAPTRKCSVKPSNRTSSNTSTVASMTTSRSSR